VPEAYGRRSAEYIALLGDMSATAEADRRFVGAWARTLPEGRILDVGCGPGHWTNWLHQQGMTVVGIDPTPEFVAHARQRYPEVSFRSGRAENLDVEDAGVAGILAWYSLIHLPPDAVPGVLTECARVIEPGGGLLLGFFTGPEIEAFDHAVTTAHFWPVDTLERMVGDAGFVVTDRDRRVDPGARPHGAIAARRIG